MWAWYCLCGSEYKSGHGIVYEAQSVNVDMVLSMRLRV